MRARIGFVLLLGALLVPAQADAYVIGGSRWPGRTVTYFNADRSMARQVALAVAAWNTSGANVRFKAVPASRARVIIRKHAPPTAGSAMVRRPDVELGICFGYADIGYQRRQEHVDLSPGCSGLLIPTAVVAHELGHILGLDHPSRGCATMTPIVWQSCKQPPQQWQFRCRFLQPDDVRGAIHLYGGRVRAKRQYCPVFAAPKAPSQLAVDPTGSTATWRNPGLPKPTLKGLESPSLYATVERVSGDCKGSAPAGQVVASPQRFLAGRVQQEPLTERVGGPGPGTWCYVVSISDQYARIARAMTSVTIANKPPVPSFEVAPTDYDPRCVYVTDASKDPDGEVRHWHLDFGAPAESGNVVDDEPSATHCYQQSGTYTVALTVTDDLGATVTVTKQITVTVPPPEEPPPEV